MKNSDNGFEVLATVICFREEGKELKEDEEEEEAE